MRLLPLVSVAALMSVCGVSLAYDFPFITARTGDSSGASTAPRQSADSRYITYRNIQGSGGSTVYRIIVKDLQLNTTRVLSSGFNEVSPPSISRDGKYVAFFASNSTQSALPYVIDVTNPSSTVQTPPVLTSIVLSALQLTWPPEVSNTIGGQTTIAFQELNQLILSNKPLTYRPKQILAWDLTTGFVTVASRTTSATYANGTCSQPVIDSSGLKIGYATFATNLGTGTDGVQHVVTAAKGSGWNTNTRISVTNAPCNWPAMDAAGRRVAYTWNSPTDPKVKEVYVNDTVSGWNGIPYVLAPFRPQGMSPNQMTQEPAISSDGLMIGFRSFRMFANPGFQILDTYYVNGSPVEIGDLGDSIFTQALPPIGSTTIGPIDVPSIQSYSLETSRRARSAGTVAISDRYQLPTEQRAIVFDSAADRILNRSSYPLVSWIYRRTVL